MVDLFARLYDRDTDFEILGLPVLAIRLVHDRACCRSYCLEWNLGGEIGEAPEKFLQRELLADHAVTELRHKHVPLGITRVEFPHFLLNIYVSSVRDKYGIAKIG